jgi:acetyltransferase-like isoleucine patch superfamily enzyme
VNEGFVLIGDDFLAHSGKYYNRIGGSSRFMISCSENAKLIIGNHVGITNCAIYCQNRIQIDDNVMIGGGSKIWDTNFHSIDPNHRGNKGDTGKNIMTSAIHLKKHAFIGAGCTILKGVTIGENSILATGSVVFQNIPDNQIWGGNPARFLGINPYRVKNL